jgi:hypothetical protein
MWFYSKNGQKIGPIAASQLKILAETGVLLQSDFVWKDGLKEWVLAKQINGLFIREQQPIIPNLPQNQINSVVTKEGIVITPKLDVNETLNNDNFTTTFSERKIFRKKNKWNNKFFSIAIMISVIFAIAALIFSATQLAGTGKGLLTQTTGTGKGLLTQLIGSGKGFTKTILDLPIEKRKELAMRRIAENAIPLYPAQSMEDFVQAISYLAGEGENKSGDDMVFIDFSKIDNIFGMSFQNMVVQPGIDKSKTSFLFTKYKSITRKGWNLIFGQITDIIKTKDSNNLYYSHWSVTCNNGTVIVRAKDWEDPQGIRKNNKSDTVYIDYLLTNINPETFTKPEDFTKQRIITNPDYGILSFWIAYPNLPKKGKK